MLQGSKTKMKASITDYIDYEVAGADVRSRKVDLATFVAGYLQKIILSNEFQMTENQVRQKILHLSFLVHLVCRKDCSFDSAYKEYQCVEEVLACGNIGWDNEDYFRDWEKKTIIKFCDPNSNVHRKAGEHTDTDEVHNFKADDFDEELKEEPDTDFDIEEYDPNSDADDYHPVELDAVKKRDYKSRKQSNNKKIKKIKRKIVAGNIIKREGKSKWHRYSCEDCNINNLSFRMHTRHLFEKHEQTLCTHCGINFDDFKVFWVHQESHKEKHICDICSNEFRSSIYLRNHKRTIHNITDEKYNNRFCQICPECGKSVDSLKQHMQLIHSPHKLQCPHCEYQTPYKNNLKNHIENKHTGVNIKNCPFCGKLVKNVKRHVLAAKCDLPEEERNNPADNVSCDRCNKQFKNLERLKKHIRDIHDKPAMQCQLCNFQTKYNCNMRMHVKRVHENKPLRETCPICNKECVSVDWHMKTYHPAEIENGFVPS